MISVSVTAGDPAPRLPARAFSHLVALPILVFLLSTVEMLGASPGDEGFLVGNGKAGNPDLPSQQLRVQVSPPARTGPTALQPDSRESAAASAGSNQGEAAPPAPREPLTQPSCTICLTGSSTVQWTGASGSFHVDYIQNYRASSTGSLQLKITLVSSPPVWGNPISSWDFSTPVVLPPLASGYQYSNVNSGTVPFYPSSIPAGLYWALLLLSNYSGSSWGYTDWITYGSKVWCNGTSCSAVTPCVESPTTMCLIGGRYRVTSQWTNQYAGGAVSTLNRATLTDATGAFWIANPSTFEYLIRIQTGTGDGHAWVSIPTFTDVEFSVLVEDLFGGQTKTYHSLPGNRDLIYDPLFFVYP